MNYLEGSCLDGNTLAGPLGELFRQDMSQVRGVCAACGRSSALAETHVHQRAPGLVARCPHCGHVLATVVEASDGMRLGLSGFRLLKVAAQAK